MKNRLYKRKKINQTEIMEKKTKESVFLSKATEFFNGIQWGDFLKNCAPVVAEVSANAVNYSLVAYVKKNKNASTGTEIDSLYGQVQYNAIMPHFCGGTKANGGGGVSGGETVLSIIHSTVKVVVQTSVDICGTVYNFHHK